MMKARKPVDDGRSLFDEVIETDDKIIETDDIWFEVPQALFLSWSAARQYAYCAERDLRASLEYATSPEEERWFYERAVSYEKMKRASL